MTKEQLKICLEALADLIANWNEPDDPEDRGPSNNALCLVLWEDGSGGIGTVSAPHANIKNLHEQIKFNTLDEAVEQLSPWLVDQ